MKKSYIFLANGFEDMEALGTADVMRRAGMDVRLAAVGASLEVVSAHGITVVADLLADEADLNEAEWLICPGGMPGAENLHASETVTKALVAHHDKGGNIAAICASPALVLYPLGLLDGRQATCYPGMGNNCSHAQMTDAGVVVDGMIITGKGPAYSIPFALAIVRESLGATKAEEVAKGLLFI